MAGSWNHLVDDDNKIAEDRLGCIENLGDAAEALEECYGMVWVLASMVVGMTDSTPSHELVVETIEYARKNYTKGVLLGSMVPARW